MVIMVVVVNDDGRAIASLPPQAVIQSSTKFPSNLGGQVEITPVYITNTGIYYVISPFVLHSYTFTSQHQSVNVQPLVNQSSSICPLA